MPDHAWERFAQSDPYWAVLTDPQFKTGGAGPLPPEQKGAFFRSGEDHIIGVTSVLKTQFGRSFSSSDCCVDFGSGVGRLLLPMAKRCGRAIGLDISPTMRRLCLENAIEAHLGNVECYSGIDHPSLETAAFDWVNSYIVFQHLETSLGYRIFRELLRRVKPNGAISVHFTVYKDQRASGYLTDSYRYFTANESGIQQVATREPFYPADVMMMNDYDIGKIYMLLGEHGFHRVYTVHEDQEGMHGLVFFAVRKG